MNTATSKMFFKKKISQEYVDLQERIIYLEKRMKDFATELEKVEIKALEGQKVYRRKLKNLLGDDEKQEDLNKSVFLSPNGAPI